MTEIYKIKDNTTVQLSTPFSSTDLIIFLNVGEGAKFPQPIKQIATSAGTQTQFNCTGVGASGLAVNDFVYNKTDGSYAVIKQVNTNDLITTDLQQGSDNTWDNGDVLYFGRFIITVNKKDVDGNIISFEKIRISERLGDNLIIDNVSDRGFDGTSAQNWTDLIYDFIEIFVEKAKFEELDVIVSRNLKDVDGKYDVSDLANQIEAEQGIVNDKLMTPQRTKEAIVYNQNQGVVLKVNNVTSKYYFNTPNYFTDDANFSCSYSYIYSSNSYFSTFDNNIKKSEYRNVTSDWASGVNIRGIVKLSDYIYVCISDLMQNSRVYRYEKNNINAGGTLMTLSGFFLNGSSRMTSDGTNLYFTGFTSNNANLIVNGGFPSSTNWVLGSGWTVGGGVASFNPTPGVNSGIAQSPTPIVTLNSKYKTYYDIVSIQPGHSFFYNLKGALGTTFTTSGTKIEYLINSVDVANVQIVGQEPGNEPNPSSIDNVGLELTSLEGEILKCSLSGTTLTSVSQVNLNLPITSFLVTPINYYTYQFVSNDFSLFKKFNTSGTLLNTFYLYTIASFNGLILNVNNNIMFSGSSTSDHNNFLNQIAL